MKYYTLPNLSRRLQQSFVFAQYFTLFCDQHGHSSFPTAAACSSRAVLHLLDGVRYLIENHFIHIEVDSSLQKRRTHQHIDASFSECPHDCSSQFLRILAVDATDMELLQSQHGYQILDRSDTVHEHEDRGRRNTSQCLQKRVLHSHRSTKPTNRVLAVTTRVTIETSLLRPPCVASTLFTRRVIGDTTQLLTKRWTEIGNVAEQSYCPLGEEKVPPFAFLEREAGSRST